MDLVVLCDHDVQRHEGVRRPRSKECNFVNKEKRILRFFFINFTVKNLFFSISQNLFRFRLYPKCVVTTFYGVYGIGSI